MATSVEIIDLTIPSPVVHEIPDSDPVPSPQPSSTQETCKKKTRRGKRASLNPDASTPDPRDSRSNSQARDTESSATAHANADARAKRKRERDDESAAEDAPAGRVSRRARREAAREQAKKQDQEREREEKTADGGRDLFFVDLAPASISAIVPTLPDPSASTEGENAPKLLVPAHVTVLGSTPVEIIQVPEDGEQDEDFINYLDYDDTKHMLRYYDEPPDESVVLNRTVCKNCGAEGEHKTSACPVQICLTCGLRNEHSTRSCPISKVCFTCGMKGHINANCPNRRTARALQSSREVECDRCYSSNHKTNECPTVWRLYEYHTPEEQAQVISIRHSKKDMKLGQGGEGYVADDEWCYYCGRCGHWGDDCQDMDRAPEEHSAFSRYNVMMGPFYDPSNERKASASRSRVRDWESLEDTSGWGKNAPNQVGRQGRMKSRAALERQAQQADDDQDDWFGNASRRSTASNRGEKKDTSKKFTFGKNMGAQFLPPTDNGRPPSLLERLDHQKPDNRDSNSRRQRSYKADFRDNGYPSGGHRDKRRREEKSSSNSRHYLDRRKEDYGQRYRGGYVPR